MTQLIRAIEIFAAFTGVLYVILEILQKKSMWLVGIVTGLACAFSFGVQSVWASMGLNLYYVAMSVWGLSQWKKAEESVGANEIHLQRLPGTVIMADSGIGLILTLAMFFLLRATGDPAPLLDAVAVALSIIATWWLAQSYLEQWLLWILADIISTVLCINTGQWAMAVMYLVYSGSAVYGYFHWKKRGKFVNSPQ